MCRLVPIENTTRTNYSYTQITTEQPIGTTPEFRYLSTTMGRKGVWLRDGLSDLFTRLRNGQHARRLSVRAPYSRLALNVLSVLLERGYIRGVQLIKPSSVKAPQYDMLEVFLKYDSQGRGAMNMIKRVSLPSRRVYRRIKDLPRPNHGLGTFILSTPRGVIHCTDARRLGIGGEVLGEVL